MEKILIVEDDRELQENLKTLLNDHGYETLILRDFEHALEEIQSLDVSLILLDIQIPHMNGEYLLKEIRKTSNVPIIMVTSRNNELDEVLSMSYGADDYITKPYNPRILLLRIEAVLKRFQGSNQSQKLKYRTIFLNIQKCELETENGVVPLSKNEMKIFHYLLLHQGNIVTREDIMKYLWDTEEFIDDNTLTVNMNRIRKKLEDAGITDAIETKRGLGYLLI